MSPKLSFEGLRIIEEVDEPFVFVSNLIIVEKPNGSLRLCLNQQDLSKVFKSENYCNSVIFRVCQKDCKIFYDLGSQRRILAG